MIIRIFSVLAIAALLFSHRAVAQSNVVAGPVFSAFPLTLDSGKRVEAVGPLFYSQQKGTEHQFGFPPLFTFTEDPDIEYQEASLLYPVGTYRRYGTEYRYQLGQLLSFSGGITQEEEEKRRFTIFPFYFQQRSTNAAFNYTAVVPFYGHLENRLFRDDIRFVMFPFYSETRRKTVVTKNYVYPIFHLRSGEGLRGWQVWPLVGKETKEVTYRTNIVDEREVIPGHDRFFALWPIYFRERLGLGTTNPENRLVVIPFYFRANSPNRDVHSYGWPFGYVHIDDRAAKYEEHGLFWPIFVYARGEGKNITRVFPFYSQARGGSKESNWYMWPVYKYNRLHSEPLDRERTRILFFLYSDISEKNTETGTEGRRVDMWPFFTFRKNAEGDQRLQVLALLEPFFPNNTTIPREYAPVYSLWRSEKNAKTGASSQSLLWNLYRNEQQGDVKKLSILLGLFQYESSLDGKGLRVLYLPLMKPARTAAAKP